MTALGFSGMQDRWNVHRIRADREARGIPSPPHPLYSTWQTMKARCNRPTAQNYENYGGRGITVCEQWASDFAEFYTWAAGTGWQKGLQIDRIDNDGPYSPSNCRWVTATDNINNRRVTPRYEYLGSLWTARRLYDIFKPCVSFTTFRMRLRNGWSVSEAIRFGRYEKCKLS